MEEGAAGTASHSREVPADNAGNSGALEQNLTRALSSLSTTTATAAPASPVMMSMAASLLDIRERRNWLIHQLYVRQEYVDCLSVIEAQLHESEGVCEYALYVKGLLKRRTGELTESLNLFQTAMLINPQNPANQRQVGQALFFLGEHRAAIDMFHEAQRVREVNGVGDDWVIQYSIGMCYMYLKDYQGAEMAFVRSLAVQRHDCTMLQLGKVLVLQRDYPRAIKLYEEFLQTSPDNVQLLTALGLLYLQVDNPPQAFHYLGKCLTLNSSNPTAIMAAASVMQNNGDFSVALNKYRVAVAKLPHSALLWSNVGMCFFAEQNMHAAVACLRKAVALAPLEWRIAYNVGLVFLHLKQYASAFHYLSASTYLHGTYAPAFMHLGVCLALMNDVDNACAAYARALSLEQDPLISLNCCITLLNCGREEEARKQLAQFTQLWHELPEAQQQALGLAVPRMTKLLMERLIGPGEAAGDTAEAPNE
ncbi:Bardet-Biedl syndrome 4 protein [Trypanosoma conorhini]|uniref:Bardet-Biedl syndrome 4 protein n=1 Tax=Trypanosoma conorhini TaxID=83891 RepID=A0A422NQ50_9TRYP|nr:Bardet-Biedl syndrome 4 protein [Trypanosoma conorhini]RNF07534.1 Bardet-Biedl syndrome 4 protein [Trypanosoma conorhini]